MLPEDASANSNTLAKGQGRGVAGQSNKEIAGHNSLDTIRPYKSLGRKRGDSRACRLRH